MKVLIVEDDPDVAETVEVAFSLRWPDCATIIHGTGKGALEAVRQNEFDLAILDLNLPDMDGFSILENIRKLSQVPVIMLTVRGSEADRVRGLEKGADDYIQKPFSPLELQARASAVIRRAASREPKKTEPVSNKLQAGPISINPETAEVMVDGGHVKLSPTEFKILTLLVENAGKIVPRDTLIQSVWGMEPSRADAYLVKLHMQHLRRKLGDSGAKSRLIVTVRGFGYRIPFEAGAPA